MSSGLNSIYRNDKDLYNFIDPSGLAQVVNCVTLNSTFVNTGILNVDQLDRQLAGPILINQDTQIVGDLILDGRLDMSLNSGKLELNNMQLSNTASGNSGQHLQIVVNGVNYKLRLENV